MNMLTYILKNKRQNAIVLLLFILDDGAFVLATLLRTFQLNSLVAKTWKAFFQWTLLALLIWVVCIVSRKLRMVAVERAIQQQVAQLRLDIIQKIEAMDYTTFKKKEASDYVSWLVTDMALVENEGYRVIYETLEAVLLVLFSSLALLHFHWLLLLCTLISSIIISLLPKLFEKQLKQKVAQVSNSQNYFLAACTDYLKGYETLYEIKKTYLLANKLNQQQGKVIYAKVAKSKAQSSMSVVLLGASILSQFAISAVNDLLILLEKVTIGSILSTGQLAGNVFNYLNTISENRAIIKSTEVILNKYAKLTDKKENCSKDKKLDFSHELTLRNISVQYPNKTICYPDITFKPGRNYAIIGESGSGKTTLVDVLIGKITNYSGDIEIDGKSYEEVDPRDFIGYQSQFPHLFKESISKNH